VIRRGGGGGWDEVADGGERAIGACDDIHRLPTDGKVCDNVAAGGVEEGDPVESAVAGEEKAAFPDECQSARIAAGGEASRDFTGGGVDFRNVSGASFGDIEKLSCSGPCETFRFARERNVASDVPC
jgi:hypothetical protein